MPILSSSIGDLILSLFSTFTSPTQQTFAELVFGWIMAGGKRAISSVIKAMEGVRSKSYSTYLGFFSKAKWDVDQLGLAVCSVAVRFFYAGRSFLYTTGDDTISRRSGPKVYGAGIHYDCSNFKATWSNSWVVLSLLVKVPFLPRPISIPILFRLYLSEKTCQKLCVPSETRSELMAETLQILRSRFSDYRIILSTDGAYANNILLSSLPLNVDLVSRVQKNARFYELPKKERRRRRGRPCKKGEKLSKLPQIAEEGSMPWIRAELKKYGKTRKRLLKAFLCLWYRVGKTRPILLVIVRDPEGKEQDQYFFTTNEELSPAEVAELMAARWSIEVAFWESKTLLGLEDNRFWVKKSVSRVAPFVFLIESIVKIWFCKWGHKGAYFSLGRAEWYHKERATFSEMLNTLRAELLASEISRTSMSRPLKRKIIRLLRNIAWAA